MTAVTIAVAEVDVVCWAADGQAIVTVEDDIVLEQHVRALGGETYQMGTMGYSLYAERLNRLTVAKVRHQIRAKRPHRYETKNSRTHVLNGKAYRKNKKVSGLNPPRHAADSTHLGFRDGKYRVVVDT